MARQHHPTSRCEACRTILNASSGTGMRTHWEELLGEELLELPAVFAKFAVETTRRLDLLTQDLAATNRRLDRLAGDVGTLKNDVGTLKNDVGILKGAHAETKARASIAVIADELDLEYRRIVPELELRRVARDNGADLRDDRIKSFVASDIIAEAVDAEGNTTTRRRSRPTPGPLRRQPGASHGH